MNSRGEGKSRGRVGEAADAFPLRSSETGNIHASHCPPLEHKYLLIFPCLFLSLSFSLSSFVSFLFEEWRERRIEESREFEEKFWREINLILFI